MSESTDLKCELCLHVAKSKRGKTMHRLRAHAEGGTWSTRRRDPAVEKAK